VKILDDNPQFNIVFTNAIANKDIFKSCMATALIRKTVFDKIGYYDSVRIAADNEYKFRYIKIFGNKQIAHIDQNLYHIRIRNNSLSRCPKTGMSSIPRNIYRQNYINWHKNNKNLYIEFPLKHRTFPAPKLIL
jgi:hypothetical protein